MKRLVVIMIIALLFSCTGQKIVQDKPQNETQCFESKFNPYRLMSEDWVAVGGANTVMVLKNKKDGNPRYVVIIIHPHYGILWRYAYLDGKDIVAYVMDMKKACYVAETIPDKIKEMLKDMILKAAKETQV